MLPPADCPLSPPRRTSWLPRWTRDGRWAVVLGLFLAAFGLAYPNFSVTGFYLAVAAALLALGVYLFRRKQSGLFGPLFRYEMVRLARSRRTAWLRGLYALALLGALWVVHGRLTNRWWLVDDAPGFLSGPSDLARMGEQFAFTILFVQNVAVLVLTPLYLCGAVIDERNRGTLDFLFASHLDDHEIILGKLAARVTALGVVLLAGLPVLALIQLWGGVSVYILVGGFAATAITLVHVASLSIFASVTNRYLFGALCASYFLTALTVFCCGPLPGLYATNPFGFLAELDHRLRSVPTFLSYGPTTVGGPVPPLPYPAQLTMSLVGLYALYHGCFILLYLILAVYWLRRAGKAEPVVEPLPDPLPAGDALPQVLPDVSSLPLFRPLAAIGEHPLWWRETRVRPGSFVEILMVLWMMWSSLYFVYWVIFFIAHLALQHIEHAGPREELATLVSNPMIRFITVTGAAVSLIAAAFQAAGSVTRERERGTLEQLLMLPDDRQKILALKWGASLWRYRWTLAFPALVWLTGCLTPALHPAGALLLVLAVAVHAAFFASLGLWLSVVCRSTLQANLTLACFLLAVTIVPWNTLGGERNPFNFLVNPVACWYLLCSPWDTFDSYNVHWGVPLWDNLGAVLGNLALYGLLAWLLWRAACWRFLRNPAAGPRAV